MADQFVHDRDPDRKVFALFGEAGTGKTYCMLEMAHRYPSAVFCEPTNKAASIIRERLGRDASTVHSFYHARKIVNDEGFVTDWSYDPNEFRGLLKRSGPTKFPISMGFPLHLPHRWDPKGFVSWLLATRERGGTSAVVNHYG